MYCFQLITHQLQYFKIYLLFLRYEIENCQVIWAIKDKSVGATFFDAGAAHFFLPCLKEAKHEENQLSKRLKYTVNNGMF